MDGYRNNYRGEWSGLWNRIARYVSGLGYTRNIGTITGILMNGVSKGNAGDIDLGNVQEKIDADHKLSADLIEDGTTNKVINVKPDWNAASGAADEILNKPTLAAVATSGDYDDLTNKPSIPEKTSDLINDSLQEELASGINIKTINNQSILGGGNITIQGGGGSGVQADWAQTDNTAADYIKNKPSSSRVYWGAWTASSSAATYTQLTNKLILPEGVYIVKGQTADPSKTMTYMLGLTNVNNMQSTNPQSSNMTFFSNGTTSRTQIEDVVFVGSGGGEVWIQTASSTSVTYSNTNRAFIAALKIA